MQRRVSYQHPSTVPNINALRCLYNRLDHDYNTRLCSHGFNFHNFALVMYTEHYITVDFCYVISPTFPLSIK